MRIEGTAGDDFLFGTEDDDEIFGRNGNDRLNGLAGADTLTGGAGGDRFRFGLFNGSTIPAATDRITDFQGAGVAGGDLIDLDPGFRPDARLTFGGLLAATPILGGGLGTAGDGVAALSYAFNSGDTHLFADTNDNGAYDAGDFTLTLSGRHELAASDFSTIRFVTLGTDRGETIDGGPESDTILALGGDDRVSGNGGNDVIEGGDGADTLNGGAGGDRIQGGEGDDTINGGRGRDRLTGDAGDDVIDGGEGDDSVLSGGDGNDVVFGRTGDDTLDGDDGDDALFGGAGEDVLFGLADDDRMEGGSGDDELFGGEGRDTLSGGSGDDELEGEEGADRLEGGDGDDVFSLFDSAFQPDSTFGERDLVLDFQREGREEGDVIRLSGGSFAFVGDLDVDPQVGAALPGAGDGVTQLGYAVQGRRTFLLADTNDNGRLDTNDFAVEFVGAHRFAQADFTGTDFVIAGTDGDDVITGTEGDDRIFAAGGNDRVSALDGSDEVRGGAGDDFLDGGPGGFDFLFGDEGDDTLTLATSDGGSAEGGAGNDLLIGSDAEFSLNALSGGGGDDQLRAGAAGAGMGGGDGADLLFSGAGDDSMDGGRDELTFELDGDQDLFVYGGSPVWSEPDSVSGDLISDFEDGVDLIDLRGSGLRFEDLEVANEEFQTTITSSRGTITILEAFDAPVTITAQDFLFDPPATLVSAEFG